MSSRLALLGGDPVRTEGFVIGSDPTTRDLIGDEEIEAVSEVLRSQRLSGFVADSSDAFLGGEKVQQLESDWSEYVGAEHCVAVNSATSGLYAAIGAAGIGPGDEVIVPPLTMSASAAAILGFNGVPVFADVDPETANIDPDSIRERITDHTEAIVVVHLFGYPAAMDEILAIADEHDLIVIEDAAQSIGATYEGVQTGTLGDIGVFSLNVHKHIHTGEGGIVATADSDLNKRVQLIRNHGETVISSPEGEGLEDYDGDLGNIIGQNYRMTELEAAVGVEQLKKLPEQLEERLAIAERLTDLLREIDFLRTPPIRDGSTHSYYVFPTKYVPEVLDIGLSTFVNALAAEGIPAHTYVEPLYLLPIYQEARLYGNTGCPFGCPWYEGEPRYERGLCPTAERLHGRELLVLDAVVPGTAEADLSDLVAALRKIEVNADDLRNQEPNLSNGVESE